MHLGIITSSFATDDDDGASAAGFFVRDFATTLAELGHEVSVVTQLKGRPGAPPAGVTGVWFAWSGGSLPVARLRLSHPRDFAHGASFVYRGFRALDSLAKE